MRRVSILIIASLLTSAGCKSANIVRLQDRSLQKYEPGVPVDAPAAAVVEDQSDSKLASSSRKFFQDYLQGNPFGFRHSSLGASSR